MKKKKKRTNSNYVLNGCTKGCMRGYEIRESGPASHFYNHIIWVIVQQQF